MRHRIAGHKLGRTGEHRTALLRNLSTALFEHEKITTTLSKAKALRPFAEKLVTLAKKESLHSRRLVLRHIHDRQVVGKLFDTLSARYASRPGGYTRIIKLGPRRGDHAELAIIELVDAEAAPEAAEAPKKKARRAKTTKSDKAAAAEAEPKPEKKTTKKKTKKKSAGKKKATKSKTTKKASKA
jgi:large subunit ribosomal protein L17